MTKRTDRTERTMGLARDWLRTRGDAWSSTREIHGGIPDADRFRTSLPSLRNALYALESAGEAESRFGTRPTLEAWRDVPGLRTRVREWRIALVAADGSRLTPEEAAGGPLPNILDCNQAQATEKAMRVARPIIDAVCGGGTP